MIAAVRRHLAGQSGAALLTVLVLIVIVGLMAGIAGTSWQTVVQRAREQELFWRGDQFRKAIQSYYEYGSGASRKQTGQYPAKLEDLIKDPRSLARKKHIRRLYTDPMTGDEWELVKDKAGRIIGVRSSSALKPFRQEGFPEEYEGFADASSYTAWEFSYVPKKQAAGSKQATTGEVGSGGDK